MPVDASIYGQIQAPKQQDPLNAMARVMQIKGLQQQQDMGAMQADEYRRGVDRTNRLQSVLAGDATPDSLRKAGFLKESMDLEKNSAEVTHKRSETTKNNAEVVGKKVGLYRDAVNGINDPASAVAYIQTMHGDPDLKGSAITAVPLEKLVAQVPQDPAQFAEWKRRFVLGADKFMVDERQRLQLVETNRHNTTTEGETGRHNRNTEGTAQGQLKVAQGNLKLRGEELTAGGKPPAGYRWAADGKTLEAIPGGPAVKSENASEGERKAATLLQRLEGSQRQLQTALQANPAAAKPEVLASGLRAISPKTEALANSITGTQRQQVDNAQLDILDAALTLGTGAAYTREQLEGYRKSYFPQIGDDAVTVQDKTDRLNNVIQAAKIAAGRAGPKQGAAPAAAPVPVAAPTAPKVAQSGLSADEQKELQKLRERFGGKR